MSANFYEVEPQTGHFVSAEHRRIAELINEYEPTLFLVWIPPDKRDHNEEYPYAILHRPENLTPYIVRKVKESEMNTDLIAWLWASDKARGGESPLELLQKQEDAREAMKLKRQQEEAAANADFMQSVLKGKNYFRHNGKVYS
jgi:hypothetical protein